MFGWVAQRQRNRAACVRRVALLCALSVAGCGRGVATLPPVGAAPSDVMADRSALAGFATGVPARSLGPVQFAVALPLRNVVELHRFLLDVANPASASYAHFLTNAQFVARYAPASADLAAVAAELRAAGFNVSVSDQAVHAGGTRAQAERYFAARLVAGPQEAFERAGPLRLSNALVRRGAMVVGFEAMHFRVHSRTVALPRGWRPDNFHSAFGPYFTSDLKEAYQFPSYREATGRGATIGIVISSPIEISDISAYFGAQHIPGMPKVTNVSVAGGGTYDPSTSDTSEATLDVEQSLGMAPGARALVFNFPSLSSGNVYDGYGAVVARDAVKVVNSSFGFCESANPFHDYAPFDQLFVEGIAEGQTFVASSGDHGDSSCGANAQGNPDVRGVSWPASSFNVLAVGGTNLKTQHSGGTNNSGYVSEEAHQDDLGGGSHWGSGGGYSTPGYYARQSWQDGFDPRPTRGVPDVALHMGGCPGDAILPCNPDDSSDVMTIGGALVGVIGTSAAAPDMVGLIALSMEIKHQPEGFGDIHDLVYISAATPGLWRSEIHGYNGYPTTTGAWDPVLGIGTPIAAYKFAGANSASGAPGSASNP
jgi:subtilase family serine protease